MFSYFSFNRRLLMHLDSFEFIDYFYSLLSGQRCSRRKIPNETIIRVFVPFTWLRMFPYAFIELHEQHYDRSHRTYVHSRTSRRCERLNIRNANLASGFRYNSSIPRNENVFGERDRGGGLYQEIYTT